jgi:hypothetical protein
MYFTDRSLLLENQPPLIITGAPYGPAWLPSDYPEDIAITWDEQPVKPHIRFRRIRRVARGGGR